MHNLYDAFLYSIRSHVQEIPYEQMQKHKRLLVVAVSEEKLLKAFADKMQSAAPTVEVVYVAQPKMVRILKELTGGSARVLPWEGAYTIKLAEHVKEEYSDGGFDGFLHFVGQSVDLRNTNLVQIAQRLAQGREDFGVYATDGDGVLYAYRDIAGYLHGIRLYEDACAYIDEHYNGGKKKTGGGQA